MLRHVLLTLTLLACICASTSCSILGMGKCLLPCEIRIDQTKEITVADLASRLQEIGWLAANYDPQDSYRYGPFGNFNLGEHTTVSMPLTTLAPKQYRSGLILDIDWIGGMSPDMSLIYQAGVYKISVFSHMTLLESWLAFGLPEGGGFWPFMTEHDHLGDPYWGPPCRESLYDVSYDKGRMWILSSVKWPPILHILTSEASFQYPIGDDFEVGNHRLENMYHDFCKSMLP